MIIHMLYEIRIVNCGTQTREGVSYIMYRRLGMPDVAISGRLFSGLAGNSISGCSILVL